MIEDKLLILRFKQGQPEALRRIYDKYKESLLKLAVQMLGNANEAEDVVHDVFVSFAHTGERLSIVGNLKSYLVTSVMNRIRNLRRIRLRQGTIQTGGSETLCSLEHGPLDWIVLSEKLLVLSQALQVLPDDQREVICCRIEMNMSFRQIAALQKVSVATVQGRYRYGIQKLRDRLVREDET